MCSWISSTYAWVNKSLFLTFPGSVIIEVLDDDHFGVEDCDIIRPNSVFCTGTELTDDNWSWNIEVVWKVHVTEIHLEKHPKQIHVSSTFYISSHSRLRGG